MTGARGLVSIYDGNTGKTTPIGMFTSISYGLIYDVAPIYTLGRYTAAETVYTAQEVVNVSASGFRIVGHGPQVEAAVPLLSKLMSHEYVQITVIDRQTNLTIATINECRPTGYSTSVNARQATEFTVNYVGILLSDENATNEEAATASNLPQ